MKRNNEPDETSNSANQPDEENKSEQTSQPTDDAATTQQSQQEREQNKRAHRCEVDPAELVHDSRIHIGQQARSWGDNEAGKECRDQQQRNKQCCRPSLVDLIALLGHPEDGKSSESLGKQDVGGLAHCA